MHTCVPPSFSDPYVPHAQTMYSSSFRSISCMETRARGNSPRWNDAEASSTSHHDVLIKNSCQKTTELVMSIYRFRSKNTNPPLLAVVYEKKSHTCTKHFAGTAPAGSRPVCSHGKSSWIQSATCVIEATAPFREFVIAVREGNGDGSNDLNFSLNWITLPALV
jgi:hypothetical protein